MTNDELVEEVVGDLKDWERKFREKGFPALAANMVDMKMKLESALEDEEEVTPDLSPTQGGHGFGSLD